MDNIPAENGDGSGKAAMRQKVEETMLALDHLDDTESLVNSATLAAADRLSYKHQELLATQIKNLTNGQKAMARARGSSGKYGLGEKGARELAAKLDWFFRRRGLDLAALDGDAPAPAESSGNNGSSA